MQSRRPWGLTLIEVLVALALWGLMTALMTQGLDLLLRGQQHQLQRNDHQARLQASLSQWRADLDQMDSTYSGFVPLDWDGRVLRWVRHSAAPLQGQRRVVAWGLQDGRWVRWQSEATTQPAELLLAWQTAARALEQPVAHTDWMPISGWQLYYYRNDGWSNPWSSADSAGALPDAIRLQLELQPRGEWQGRVQWDWLRPNWSVNRS
jgi:general secretion pathway protein J